MTTVQATVNRLLASGCQIAVNDFGLVKVRGRCSDTDIALLQANSGETREAVTTKVTADEQKAIDALIGEWEQVCTPARGYTQGIRNWLTDRIGKNLDFAIKRYQSGEGPGSEVVTAFREWKAAVDPTHHTKTTVVMNGATVQTVTPQIQPQASDFARMLQLLDMTEDEYLTRLKFRK